MSFSADDLKKGLGKSLSTSSKSLTTSSNLQNLKKGLSIGNTNNSLDNRVNSLATKVLPQAKLMLNETSTELIFMLDCSGSCSGTEKATILSFNDFVKRERKTGYKTIVSTILFNEFSENVHNRLDINMVGSFNYKASGGTALYDALYDNLTTIYKQQKNMGVNAPKKTIVVIMTDGDDRHSKWHDINDVRNLITDLKAKGWEFIFLGAMDYAKSYASKLGISSNNAERYLADSSAASKNFEAVRRALHGVRENGKIAPDWSAPIKNNNPALGSVRYTDDNNPTLRLGAKK